ncbi:MAG: hypothetical protein MAGBODY4_00806 [Candidatus Marinimicrobia bacterium]|nr:hypothetical protein [Candidatus Neomarinimicrobiota bacterium]
MNDPSRTQRITDRTKIPPELIWSKYSVIQSVVFWLLALGTWHGLHWLGSNYERFTLPVWRYVARVRYYFYTGDFERMVMLGLAVAAALLAGLLLTDYVIAKFKGIKTSRQILRNYYLLPRTNKQSFVAMLVGVNAGVFEEIFFRGGIFTLFFFLTNSAVLGILITSIIFALLHASLQGWLSAVWIFLFGVVLNILVLITETYIAAIVCHITINIANLFLVPAMFEEELEALLLEKSGIPPEDIPE